MRLFGTLFRSATAPVHLEFDTADAAVGLKIIYDEAPDESAHIEVRGASQPLAAAFVPRRIDEAHILYMEATEILHSRAKAGESAAQIQNVLQQLFAKYQRAQ